jgi:hypothetical protein
MNDTIQSLIGTDGTFEANIAVTVININLFDGHGNGLGVVAASGGVGTAVIGGNGSYESA